ncbi:MAG: glycosyltransferase family 2 protein [Planctomycetota bacterium]|jgi:glycosyltransferase involved in cell wall biosynthesis
MSAPTVSIIVPTYNRAELLPRALDSITAQTFDDWEIVLVDDGSTDDTEALATEYGRRLGDRFIYVRQSHAGCAAARNGGIDVCRGRFVAFLDSDDEYLPRKLERQLALFECRPELGLVYGDFAYVDLEGKCHDSVFDTSAELAREVPFETVSPGLCVCTGSLFEVLVRGYFIGTIAGMIRKEVLGDGIRFREVPSYGEEWLFYLKVSKACPAGFVDEPLCLHHWVRGSITRRDSHRNQVRHRDLLREMRRCFRSDSPTARRAIRGNLAHSCRQLGYETYRMGHYGRAAGYFAESFINGLDLRSLVEAVRAGVRWILPGGSVEMQNGAVGEIEMEVIR